MGDGASGLDGRGDRGGEPVHCSGRLLGKIDSLIS